MLLFIVIIIILHHTYICTHFLFPSRIKTSRILKGLRLLLYLQATKRACHIFMGQQIFCLFVCFVTFLLLKALHIALLLPTDFFQPTLTPPPCQQFYVARYNVIPIPTLCGLCFRRGTQPREPQSFMDSKHTWSLFQGRYFPSFLLYLTGGRMEMLYLSSKDANKLPLAPEGDTISFSKAIYSKPSLKR